MENGKWVAVHLAAQLSISHSPFSRPPSQHLLPPASVEVDLGARVRNAERFARAAGVPLLPMVKADAYGLGAVRVAQALLSVSPWGFGVATVEEGEELRAARIDLPILIFS